MPYRDPEKRREHARKNRDRIKEYNRAWHARHPGYNAEKMHRRYWADPEKWRERSKKNHAKNRDRDNARARVYRVENKEKVAAAIKAWEVTHPESHLRASRRFHAKTNRTNRTLDLYAPKVVHPSEVRLYSSHPGAVKDRKYRWRKKLRAHGVPEEMLNEMVGRIERSHIWRRHYLMYWSLHQDAASRHRSKIKQEEQARFALAMTGG